MDAPKSVVRYDVYRDGTLLGSTQTNQFSDQISGQTSFDYMVTANWSDGCFASVQRSFLNIAQILCTPEQLDFYTNYGTTVPVRKAEVTGIGINTPITASVIGPFQISTDSIHFYSSLTLPYAGATLYVKYNATSNTLDNEYGLLELSSGNVANDYSLIGHCFDRACPAPAFLTASQNGNNINLAWEDPIYPSESQELTWDDERSNMYTTYSAQYVECVQRFEPQDLTGLHHKKLSAITFYSYCFATYHLVVYVGGSMGTRFNSGTQVVDQIVTPNQLNAYGWNTIALDNPVVIDANQELWFGVLMDGSENAILISANRHIPNKGGLIRTNNDGTYWGNWLNFNSNNFLLRATIESYTPEIINSTSHVTRTTSDLQQETVTPTLSTTTTPTTIPSRSTGTTAVVHPVQNQ